MRLSLDSNFARLRSKGKRFPERFLYLIVGDGDGEGTKLGIEVSKKVGGAVRRNKLKRRIREIFRRSVDRFPQGKHLLLGCRKGAAELSYAMLEKEMLKLADKSSNK